MKLPLALQPLRCGRPDCTLPQGGRCAREAELPEPPDPVTQCPSLARETGALEPTPVKRPSIPPPDSAPGHYPSVPHHGSLGAALPSTDPEPWRGRHLSMAEATSLLQRSPARLVAVLGEHDAGKTCLLASFFLQLASGERAPLPFRFASSRSLHGWRDFVDRAGQWTGERSAEIVGHTPRIDEPGSGHFLHLGLRPEDPDDNRHVDLLLTDLPGEQITRWSLSAGAAARQHIPYLERADGFVVVVDAEQLLSPKGVKLDSQTSLLVRRIAESKTTSAQRGLSLVLSKFDLVVDQIPIPPEDRLNRDGWGPIGKRLRQTWPALMLAKERGIDVHLFATSAFPSALTKGQPVEVVEPFAHVLACADRRTPWPRVVAPVPEGASWFQSMRRWEAS